MPFVFSVCLVVGEDTWVNMTLDISDIDGHYYVLREDTVSFTCHSGPITFGTSSFVTSPLDTECFRCSGDGGVISDACADRITATCHTEGDYNHGNGTYHVNITILGEAEGEENSRVGEWGCRLRDVDENFLLEELGTGIYYDSFVNLA